MSSVLKPIKDFVVCKPEAKETQTKGGLLIPDNAQERPKIAEVLAVGKNVQEIKVGDKVIYKSYSTTDIRMDEDEFILVKEEDILATVKEGK